MQLVAQIRPVHRLVQGSSGVYVRAHDYGSDGTKPLCAWDDRADIERSSPSLLTMRSSSLLRSKSSSSPTSRPTRSCCSLWSPSRTSNRCSATVVAYRTRIGCGSGGVDHRP
jgi:hypothetical protein